MPGKLALSISLCFLMVSCNPPQNSLQNGDLLFLSYTQGVLSGAIDEVTQTAKATHYAHMGIVRLTATDTFVYHASATKGVTKEKLSSFIKSEDAATIDVYRMQHVDSIHLKNVFAKAESRLGLPYNPAYVWVDTAFYCSQYIYHIFEGQQFFKLNPMTFKEPLSGQFHPDWVTHYQKLGVDIPEGQPGCNPNGMAANSKLVFIGPLKTTPLK